MQINQWIDDGIALKLFEWCSGVTADLASLG